MALHSVIQYLKYRWKAKGRHGTHSPFVYDFIEHVLLDKGPIDRAAIVSCPDIPLKYENLVSRIVAYYNLKSVVMLPAPDTETKSTPGMLLLNEVSPADWMNLFNSHINTFKNERAVVITGIHKTAAHAAAWKAICADDRVRLSIDVYGLGMLFFRKEFKEKQHFILKY